MPSTSAANSTAPSLHRKGVIWDVRAKQFVCRVGYNLSAKGERVRAFQYLSADPDSATLKHIQLQREWEQIEQNWDQFEHLKYGLPESLRHADLSKPIWPRPEWSEAARAMLGDLQAAGSEIETSLVADFITDQVRLVEQVANGAGTIATVKAQLEPVADPAGKWFDRLPVDLQERLTAAMNARPAKIENGPRPVPMTIAAARDAYVDYRLQKVGLAIPGLRRGGGLKPQTYNGLVRELDYALKHLDTAADLNTLTHERLEQFRDACYRAAKSPRTAFNYCKSLKALLDWADKNRKVDYASPETINDIFALARPESTGKLTYDAATVAKLKAAKAAAAETIAIGGVDAWVFGLLALNTGAYQVDVASWTYDNLKFTEEGAPYIWWARQKTSHQNTTLCSRHDLWPETWAQMQKYLAPNDPKKNPERRLFLTKHGVAMYRTGVGLARLDVIGSRWKKCCSKAIAGQDEKGNDIVGVVLPYMQLRKIALNAIKKAAGGSDDVVRKFAGQKNAGVLRAYLTDEFADVGEALTKFGATLRADGVL